MTEHKQSYAELPRDDAIAMLRKHSFGRLAFAFHDRVDIEPISYVYDEGWLYGRTSPGAKLTTVHHHPWVAFEIDEVVNSRQWQSVVVHGGLYVLDRERGETDRAHFDAALEILRAVDPAVLTSTDAAPHRDILFRIHVDQVSGRRAPAT
jgi:hypothetical protein